MSPEPAIVWRINLFKKRSKLSGFCTVCKLLITSETRENLCHRLHMHLRDEHGDSKYYTDYKQLDTENKKQIETKKKIERALEQQHLEAVRKKKIKVVIGDFTSFGRAYIDEDGKYNSHRGRSNKIVYFKDNVTNYELTPRLERQESEAGPSKKARLSSANTGSSTAEKDDVIDLEPSPNLRRVSASFSAALNNLTNSPALPPLNSQEYRDKGVSEDVITFTKQVIDKANERGNKLNQMAAVGQDLLLHVSRTHPSITISISPSSAEFAPKTKPKPVTVVKQNGEIEADHMCNCANWLLENYSNETNTICTYKNPNKYSKGGRIMCLMENRKNFYEFCVSSSSGWNDFNINCHFCAAAINYGLGDGRKCPQGKKIDGTWDENDEHIWQPLTYIHQPACVPWTIDMYEERVKKGKERSKKSGRHVTTHAKDWHAVYVLLDKERLWKLSNSPAVLPSSSELVPSTSSSTSAAMTPEERLDIGLRAIVYIGESSMPTSTGRLKRHIKDKFKGWAKGRLIQVRVGHEKWTKDEAEKREAILHRISPHPYALPIKDFESTPKQWAMVCKDVQNIENHRDTPIFGSLIETLRNLDEWPKKMAEFYMKDAILNHINSAHTFSYALPL